MLKKINSRRYILKETVSEDAPVNSVAGGGVDMAPNAKGTKVFMKRNKLDGRTKEYREAARRIKERKDKLHQREVEAKLSQFGISAMESTTMDNNKYLETKPGSIEDAVLQALNPNAEKETLTLPKTDEEDIVEYIQADGSRRRCAGGDGRRTESKKKPANKDEIEEEEAEEAYKSPLDSPKAKAAREKLQKTLKGIKKKNPDHPAVQNVKEDNTNDKSDDGEGMDKVQPKAVKKKFDDRKDKDIDNDGDVDSSDEYLHKRRKAISAKMKESRVSFRAFRENSKENVNEAVKGYFDAEDPNWMKKSTRKHGIKAKMVGKGTGGGGTDEWELVAKDEKTLWKWYQDGYSSDPDIRDFRDTHLEQRENEKKKVTEGTYEAHEIGTDEYANYTKEMTPGEAITNKDARKADANKKKEQAAQQNQLNVDEKSVGPDRRKVDLGGNKRKTDSPKKIPFATKAEANRIFQELSNKTMDSYAKKATASQADAEKKGDYKKADKRMAGKMRASRRKFSNDTNKILRGLNK